MVRIKSNDGNGDIVRGRRPILIAVVGLLGAVTSTNAFTFLSSSSTSVVNHNSYHGPLDHRHLQQQQPSNTLFRPHHPAETGSIATATALYGRNRGLEIQMEGATPTEGGMILYLKAGPDGASVGDCPFAQYVRMVLEEKKLPYTVRPCTASTKPTWLVDHYEGKMPALRHRSEAYTESDVIAQYLEFFFQDTPLKDTSKEAKAKSKEAKAEAAPFLPALARYLKHTPNGDDDDEALRTKLEAVLRTFEERLSSHEGPFFVGETLTLLDCSLAPQLYHLKVGVKYLKENKIDLPHEFPALTTYMDAMFARPSFVESSYPEETVVWGWSDARN